MDFPLFPRLLFVVLLVMVVGNQQSSLSVVDGLACNLGTRSSHPLPGDIVVKLMKDNGFNKVKLFEADPPILKALGRSGIQVMVGIPNDMLAALASSVQAAENWVSQNVSSFISKNGVDIRYVAVGNEPFLKTYKDRFVQTLFPALKNVQAALIKAGLGRQVKVTVPLNADVYDTPTGVPSGGNFRSDIHQLMVSIVKFLSDNGGPLTINIYPFLSLYADPHFPVDYAFFNGAASPVVDGSTTYTNVLDANYDTLVWALEKNGFGSLPIIIGEVGWPTDGDKNANVEYARKFNQGLMDRIIQGRGTPKRPTSPPDVYLFGLIDEDEKSIDPGNFERHWGLFNYDGTIKYQLNLGNNGSLTPAKGVRYLARQWCVMAPNANLMDRNLPQSINYACSYADCTSLGYGSSCGTLDARSNASYAFNMYYQTMNQQKGACGDQFHNLSVLTRIDPSPPMSPQGRTCRFEIMIDVGTHEKRSPYPGTSAAATKHSFSVLAAFQAAFTLVLIATALP
ncbi:glucan endo-1,3-beta-glucosidase 5-like [Ipomoea triloba]|uniref:glucan endo-1,3-beta-glucosidase 5-like n=1 Tax=Ipomoea triloba TaxID=35885 RepID=UPI00125D03FB|nr:glucan endo-1,3-beta-glucosidase 5-like [Ipomoea triloba]